MGRIQQNKQADKCYFILFSTLFSVEYESSELIDLVFFHVCVCLCVCIYIYLASILSVVIINIFLNKEKTN